MGKVIDLDRKTLSDVISVLEGDELEHGYIRDYAAGRIRYDIGAREAYSYGRHFPLFRMLEAPGPRGRRARYLLNGERWTGGRGWAPSRTPEHQDIVRRMLEHAETVILPFGALTGAGIDLDTVRALDVRPDTWTELEREARTLDELPRHQRTETYEVEREAPSLEQVPEDRRKTWRAPTELERAAGAGGRSDVLPITSSNDYLDRLPDADGLYRWTETRTRDRRPDDDGRYRWTERVHSLGEAVFSAVRAETSIRAARPFEAESETRTRTVELEARQGENGWRGYCSSEASATCEAGPAAACIHCGAELRARVTVRRRSRFLSGFDTNENPALYFLCELPRGAGATVEQARESLAPRAVHAALARGIEVRRQGDIFLVDTPLTRAELAERGASFARLTLWTRDAKPREGEPGFVAPVPAELRRKRARRELKRARELWRASFEEWSTRAVYSAELEQARLERREESRRRAAELESRQAAELAEHGAGALEACGTCAARIGEACATIPDSPDIPERLRGAQCGSAGRRRPLADAHAAERRELWRELGRKEITYLRPSTGTGYRRRTREARRRALETLERGRRDMRAAVLAGPEPITRYGQWTGNGYAKRPPSLAEWREQTSARLERARTALDERTAEYLHELRAGARVSSRDAYRANPRGKVARELWHAALEQARREHRPETVFDTGLWRERRERNRRACSIYGTAHSATELARVRGAVYVRGIVSHVPSLEPGRDDVRDHRPITLTPDRWYLAVRNTVPRDRSRRDR